MNILYLSHLTNNIFAGPNFSVPASIRAQQKYDNCYWLNLTDACQEHWKKVECYHTLKELSCNVFSLDKIPVPFSKPDLVVFEGFYNQGLYDPIFAKQLSQRGVPYIIVPRGSLTRQAMNNHGSIKKRIAHCLFFDRYCNKALAIQYLTEQEYKDSYKKWNKNHLIIPNGFNEPKIKKTAFSTSGIKLLFIGRPDAYHKGIDILWEGMKLVRDELVQAGVSLDFYGPKGKYDYDLLEQQMKDYGLEDIVIMHDQISGREKEGAILASDVFVMTSRFEGHPMGLVEALAYGLPSLVTPGTNMADEISNAGAGWKCEGTPTSVANALKMIIKENKNLKEKSENAIHLAAHYQWDNIAKVFHSQIKSLLSRLNG